MKRIARQKGMPAPDLDDNELEALPDPLDRQSVFAFVIKKLRSA